MSRSRLALPLLLVLACTQPQPLVRAPAAGWANTFIAAHRAAELGDYVRADTLLATYARANPDTPESFEAIYWRGVFALDPANADGSPAMAAGAFDEYLRTPRAQTRRGEALVLRRLAVRLDAAGRLETPLSGPRRGDAAPAATAATADSARRADPRDQEIAKLREELRKSNEELERIKRRIAAPARIDPPSTPPPAP